MWRARLDRPPGRFSAPVDLAVHILSQLLVSEPDFLSHGCHSPMASISFLPAPKTGGVVRSKWARFAAARRTHIVQADSLFSCAQVHTLRMSYCHLN